MNIWHPDYGPTTEEIRSRFAQVVDAFDRCSWLYTAHTHLACALISMALAADLNVTAEGDLVRSAYRSWHRANRILRRVGTPLE